MLKLGSASQGCIHVVWFVSGMGDHSMVSVILTGEHSRYLGLVLFRMVEVFQPTNCLLANQTKLLPESISPQEKPFLLDKSKRFTLLLANPIGHINSLP